LKNLESFALKTDLLVARGPQSTRHLRECSGDSEKLYRREFADELATDDNGLPIQALTAI
jgi:hypothetical protein